MEASILASPPVSGSVEEEWFDAAVPSTWVRFDLDDGSSWVGVFGDGPVFAEDKSLAVRLGETSAFLVVADGLAYLVDARSRKLIARDDHIDWHSAVVLPDRPLAVLAGFTNLIAFDPSGVVWRSDRVALDGIKLVSARKGCVYGKVYWDDYAWHDFALDTGTWELTRE